MAASNRAKRTLLVEAQTGLRIYVLDFLADLQQWIVGPDGADPRTLDPDNLPEGFSYVCPDHTTVRGDAAEIVFYSQNEHWRDSPYIGGLIDSALATAGATGEEAACDIDTADFRDLLDDFQCDVINFLGDRGYAASYNPKQQRHGIGVIVDTCTPEQQAIIEKALEAAVAASKQAYEERAASLVQGLRAIEQEKQDAKRLALFGEVVDLLERGHIGIGMYGLRDDIKDFLAKVAKK